MTGKERRDYLLGLGSGLAAFGSLIGGISTCVEMYYHDCTVPLKLRSDILHAKSRTLSYLLVCLFIHLFIHSLTSVGLFDLQDRPLGELSGHHCSVCFQSPVGLCSSAATQPLFPLKSDTEKKQKPSHSWCT